MAKSDLRARLRRIETAAANLRTELHAAAQDDLVRRYEDLSPDEQADLDAILDMAAATPTQTAVIRRLRAGDGMAVAWRFVETLPADERNEVYWRCFGAPYTPELARQALYHITTGGGI